LPQSPELAGGAGYTFEDLVAGRYLAALLCESAAPGAEGAIITEVALQQRDFGEPLDDVIVDFRRQDAQRARLSLQVKRSLVISSAATNTDFREIIRDSLSTLRKADFREGIDRFGAAVGTVASGSFRDLTTLCELARASETVAHFDARFAEGGNASVGQRAVRDDVAALLSEQCGAPCPGDLIHRFLQHFILVHFDYLHEGAADSAAAVNCVRAALSDADGGEAPKRRSFGILFAVSRGKELADRSNSRALRWLVWCPGHFGSGVHHPCGRISPNWTVWRAAGCWTSTMIYAAPGFIARNWRPSLMNC